MGIDTVKNRHIILVGILFLGITFIGGCRDEVENPVGTVTVSELLETPVYDTEVRVFGKVSLLGELLWPCFELTSGGDKVDVWYDLMVDDGGRERPPVSVEGITNGDWVVVTGELKTMDLYRSLDGFWASGIEAIAD
jgi:hypothetical protein